MFRQICHTLLFRWGGWKEEVDQPRPAKCIICIAPHTSNWDFILGELYMHSQGLKINFLMKKEWFWGPLKPLFLKMGGIPVYRSKHTSLTDNLAEEARKRDSFKLCITPEGTRSLNPEWKRGFYFIAMKANIPVLLYGVDYERKIIECTKSIVPSGDVDNEMSMVKQYFKDYKGKRPEKFTIGEE